MEFLGDGSPANSVDIGHTPCAIGMHSATADRPLALHDRSLVDNATRTLLQPVFSNIPLAPLSKESCTEFRSLTRSILL